MTVPQNFQDNTVVRGNDSVPSDTATFMNHVYSWMTLGIFLTSLTAYLVASNFQWLMQLVSTSPLRTSVMGSSVTHAIPSAFVGSSPIFIGLIAFQVVAVIALTFAVERITYRTAKILFVGYSIATGMTTSIIFTMYTQQSIIAVFIATTAAFAGLSAVGYTLKRDLGVIATFCMMGLFGMIAIMVLSFFFHSLLSTPIQMTIAVVGLIIFSVFTVYDTQKLKALSQIKDANMQKEAIHAALILYLDFINLFLSMLRLMGRRR